MAFVLEGAHPLERDRAPHVDVGRRDIDTELHAQGATELQLGLEPTLREHVNGVPGQTLDHGLAHEKPTLETCCGPTSATVAQPIR